MICCRQAWSGIGIFDSRCLPLATLAALQLLDFIMNTVLWNITIRVDKVDNLDKHLGDKSCVWDKIKQIEDCSSHMSHSYHSLIHAISSVPTLVILAEQVIDFCLSGWSGYRLYRSIRRHCVPFSCSVCWHAWIAWKLLILVILVPAQGFQIWSQHFVAVSVSQIHCLVNGICMTEQAGKAG